MAEQDYREKIKKLLALSESSNEHEAKSALLKAKKLMAEHKIAEIDLEDIGKRKVVHIKTEFDCSKRREAWMISLSAIIGQNFCCQSYRRKEYNKQAATICFVGLEGDVDACVEIFRYAVECIRSGIDDLRKKSKDCTREYRKRLCDGYGFGYTQMNFGLMYSFLYVSEYIEEWKMDMEDLGDNQTLAYVVNTTMPDCSEFGTIGIEPSIGGLKRIW